MHGNIDCMEQPEEYQKMAVPGMLSDILRLQHRRNEPLDQCYLSLLLIFHDKEKTAEINRVKRRG